MLAWKKASRYTGNKFTLNWKIYVLLLLMWKITQLQKNGKKMYLNFNYCIIYKR